MVSASVKTKAQYTIQEIKNCTSWEQVSRKVTWIIFLKGNSTEPREKIRTIVFHIIYRSIKTIIHKSWVLLLNQWTHFFFILSVSVSISPSFYITRNRNSVSPSFYISQYHQVSISPETEKGILKSALSFQSYYFNRFSLKF